MSPFLRVVALDYYDGPVEGLLACSVCEQEYAFRLLAWDSDFDARLYALARLPSGSIDRVEEILARFGPPSRPLWVPVCRFDTTDEEVTAHQAVDNVLASAQPEELLVLTHDLVKKVDAVFRPGPEVLAELRMKLGEGVADLHHPSLSFLHL